jgi:phosphoserine phosphatase RsbU/P
MLRKEGNSSAAASLAADVALVQRIGAVPNILKIICDTTGMGFSAIGRVTETSWTACAVLDRIAFGLQVGGQVEIGTTFCKDVRAAKASMIIDHADADPDYRSHPTPALYGFQSYVAVPILRSTGEVFGTICAFDPLPKTLKSTQILPTMEMFAQLVAAQIELEEQLEMSRTALVDAEAIGQLREQFIAILGHDLRNPVAALSSGLTLLERCSLEARAAGVVKLMRQSCGRIASLIDDTLDFARGRLGGGFPLKLRWMTDLATNLDQIVEEMRSAHPEAAIETSFNFEAAVQCDPDRVCQLLSNLLANALTHGAANAPVFITARSNTDAFYLSVTNAGPPIPTEKIPLLFRPFTRGVTTESGLGLGLFIGAEIARSHAGSLKVCSTADATTFTFEMPNGRLKTMPWKPRAS